MTREMVQVMAEELAVAAAVVELAAVVLQRPCPRRHQNFLVVGLVEEPVVPELVAVVLRETPMTTSNVVKKKSAAITANQAIAVYPYRFHSVGLQMNVWI